MNNNIKNNNYYYFVGHKRYRVVVLEDRIFSARGLHGLKQTGSSSISCDRLV